jgi:hypothetical protein
MNLSLLLKYKEIESLAYDSVFLEKPMPDIINFDYRNILSAPQTNTEQKTIKELEYLSYLTLNRSTEDLNKVHEIDQDIDPLFINILAKNNIVYPIDYIKTFYNIIKPVLMNTKGFWNRPRPIQLAKLLNIKLDVIITDTVHSASYPSGHTVYSSLVANIIKDLYPQVNSSQLDKVVAETAKARMTQGVHYPSDNRASIIFSKFVFDKLNAIIKKEYYDE